MATFLIPRRSNAGSHRHHAVQKYLIEKHFPCFRCRLHKGILTCVGDITPSEHCNTYRIEIRLNRGDVPMVRILEPRIPSEIYRRVHIYRNGTLCLFDPRERPWSNRDNLHETVIPWTAEWLVYYELFLISGEWHGPEAPHGDQPKEPQDKAKAL
jgi:hypothetical protein